jgi:hypothetical protein
MSFRGAKRRGISLTADGVVLGREILPALRALRMTGTEWALGMTGREWALRMTGAERAPTEHGSG